MNEYLWGFEIDDIVLNHPVMQFQRGHKQLGQIEAIYPGATHTRFDHMGYAKLVSYTMCKHLQKKGRLQGSLNDIVQTTKLHDLGHYPFSHAVEYVMQQFTKMNHKERGIALIDSPIQDNEGRTLIECLFLAGADPARVKAMLRGTDPAGRICTHKVIGADTCGYLWMDADKTQFDQPAPDWRRLIPFLTFMDDDLGFDLVRPPSALDTPIGILTRQSNFKFHMYAERYLTQVSMVYERHIQRAVELAITNGALNPHEVCDMADDALIHLIQNGKSKRKDDPLYHAREALLGFTTRSPYEPVVALKYGQYSLSEVEGEHAHPISEEFGARFIDTFANPLLLTKLEDQLTEEFGVPMLVALLPDAAKMKPADVNLYVRGRKESTLLTLKPGLRKEQMELADQFFAIRVHVPPSEAGYIGRKHEHIATALQELAKTYFSSPLPAVVAHAQQATAPQSTNHQ